jgi:hypothetical protein
MRRSITVLTGDRPVLVHTWASVMREIHAAHLDYPSRERMDGLHPPAGPRRWVDGHPDALRYSMVKFMPQANGEDGPLRNHGMGLDVWAGKGLHVRAWSHGKGYLEFTWNVDPTPEDLRSALRYMARWVGFNITKESPA